MSKKKKKSFLKSVLFETHSFDGMAFRYIGVHGKNDEGITSVTFGGRPNYTLKRRNNINIISLCMRTDDGAVAEEQLMELSCETGEETSQRGD